MKTPRSFLASQRNASRAVRQAEKFSLRLPVVGQVSVLPPDQLAFYAALGLLAAFELIDWPVAVAIGVAQAVVARHFAEQNPPAGSPAAPAGATATAPALTAAAPAPKPAARKAAPRKSAPRKTSARNA